MYNITDYKEYKGQPVDGKSVLCWGKGTGYFFMSFHSYLLAMSESPVFKVVGIQK